MRHFLVVCGLCAAMPAHRVLAAPLSADKTSEVKARWVAAVSTRCDRVCAARGAEAENMLVYSSDGGDIYLCRVRKPPANRFGTNYEGVCKIEDADAPAGTALEKSFECLCVWTPEIRER